MEFIIQFQAQPTSLFLTLIQEIIHEISYIRRIILTLFEFILGPIDKYGYFLQLKTLAIFAKVFDIK